MQMEQRIKNLEAATNGRLNNCLCRRDFIHGYVACIYDDAEQPIDPTQTNGVCDGCGKVVAIVDRKVVEDMATIYG